MEDSHASSPVLMPLPGSLMSKNTAPSVSATDFSRLALSNSSSGSSGRRMVATTRAMSRRQALTSSPTSSRANVPPSRVVRGGMGGMPGRQPSQVPEPDDEDDSDEDSENNSDDGDEGSVADRPEDGDGNNNNEEEMQQRRQLLRVFDIFALSEPNQLIGNFRVTSPK
jgi:hypothetical protein